VFVHVINFVALSVVRNTKTSLCLLSIIGTGTGGNVNRYSERNESMGINLEITAGIRNGNVNYLVEVGGTDSTKCISGRL